MTASLSALLPALCARWTPLLLANNLPAARVAELVPQGDHLVPAEPTAPGQHRPLALDARGGCVYLRRAGELELERTDDSTCARKRLQVTVPLRLVAVFDAEVLACRSAETTLVAAEKLLAILETAGLPVAEVGAARLRLLPTRVLTDVPRLLEEELGTAAVLPAARVAVGLTLSCELTLDPSCLPSCSLPTN